jgi:hypothetical protein
MTVHRCFSAFVLAGVFLVAGVISALAKRRPTRSTLRQSRPRLRLRFHLWFRMKAWLWDSTANL